MCAKCGIDGDQARDSVRDLHPCFETAGTRKPSEAVKEDIQDEQSEPEDRDRSANECHEAGEVVRLAIMKDGPENPKRNPYDESEKHRGKRELDCARYE